MAVLRIDESASSIAAYTRLKESLQEMPVVVKFDEKPKDTEAFERLIDPNRRLLTYREYFALDEGSDKKPKEKQLREKVRIERGFDSSGPADKWESSELRFGVLFVAAVDELSSRIDADDIGLVNDGPECRRLLEQLKAYARDTRGLNAASVAIDFLEVGRNWELDNGKRLSEFVNAPLPDGGLSLEQGIYCLMDAICYPMLFSLKLGAPLKIKCCTDCGRLFAHTSRNQIRCERPCKEDGFEKYTCRRAKEIERARESSNRRRLNKKIEHIRDKIAASADFNDAQRLRLIFDGLLEQERQKVGDAPNKYGQLLDRVGKLYEKAQKGLRRE